MSDRAEQFTVEPGTFIWQPTVDGRERDLTVTLYPHPDASDRAVQVHYYGGLGEQGLALPKAVAELGENAGLAVTAVDLPFDELPAEGKYIEFVATEGPIAAARYLNERAGKPADTPAHRMGSSKGGGIALMSGGADPGSVDIVGVMGPVGLTGEVFQGHPLGPQAAFLMRLGLVNGLMRREQMLLLDPRGNMDAIKEVGGYVLGQLREGRLNGTLDFALDVNLLPDVQELIRTGHDLGIFVGKRDPIFKPKEVAASLDTVGAGDKLHIISGSHGTTNNRGGRRQLREVGGWVGGVEAAREQTAA